MNKVLLSLPAFIFMGAAVHAEPARLTDAQLDQVSAGGLVIAPGGLITLGPIAVGPNGNVGIFNTGTGNVGAFNGGTGNVGAFNGVGNTGANDGNFNIGAFNGNLNTGDNNGNFNIGAFNGNANGGSGNGNLNIGAFNGNGNGNLSFGLAGSSRARASSR